MPEILRKAFKNKHVRQIVLILIDACIVMVSMYISLFMRFVDEPVPYQFAHAARVCLPIDIAITIAVFWLFKLYHSVWSFASLREVIKIFEATTVVTLIEIAYKTLTVMPMPRSVYFMNYGCMLLLVSASRMFIRIVKDYLNREKSEASATRTMIVGAGSAASLLLNEFVSYYGSSNEVICLIDDNKNKWGRYLQGIKIVGGRDKIIETAEKEKIDDIIVAMPGVPQDTVSDIIDICNKTDCRVRILPKIVSTLHGNIASRVRDISYEDFLARDPVEIDNSTIGESVRDKVILVTGGGGSIGSELCRQIASMEPKQLLILDIYENNAYTISMELKQKYPQLDVRVLISSVRDERRLECIFERCRPQIVFHAAAHKHVPLMEYSPNEAVKNNCGGTWKTAKFADKYGAEKFVLISTDKAVRPTSVMGATKRICEMIIQDWASRSKTKFVAVRFGNVLGSNGSVIPLFLSQIEAGGPVTVTHPDITRFFMTIPEAVSLVLQAEVYAKGGEIFVLDMGRRVRIYDLAESLIKMKGYRPNKDIKIEITGLRPGEKMYEEVLMDEEGMETTPNGKIFIGRPIDMDYNQFEERLEELTDMADRNVDDIKERVRELCPEYKITDNQDGRSL
ncbi:MAG: nucleoside-diphosphate sugar epimerase/dehydratase [Anaerovoracaceae bacterium]|nr:nucleoside-diphosphate sugar epimerase/dehydratase [Anaerovoracaceae bacterium]